MNHKSLTGREVISIDSGRKLGQIDRILFDSTSMKIDSVVVRPSSHSVLAEPGPLQRVAVDDIRGLGQDVVTVQSDDVLQPMSGDPASNQLMAFDHLESEAVMTEGGKKVGELHDIEFDDQSMQIQSIEISHGFLQKKTSISASEIISVGEDVIVVHDAADPELHNGTEEPESAEGFDRVREVSDSKPEESSTKSGKT